MPTLETAAPKKPRKPRKPNCNAPFLAPYEASTSRNPDHRKSVGSDHGGYGILAEGYIHGPFFLYEVAVAKTSELTGRSGRVVRWVDFVDDSTRNPAFLKRLALLTIPLTFPVYGPGQLAPVVWR